MIDSLNFKSYKEEKINGRVYLISPSPNPVHGETIVNIVTIFKMFVKEHGKHCKVYGDSIDVYLAGNAKDNYVIPDVSVICDLNKITSKGCMGVPDLIVEVLSPVSIDKDEEEKLALYERYSVPEYWIVDYNYKTIKQYILGDKKYNTRKTFVLLDENEFNRLPKEDQASYAKKFKTSVFDDLEIELNDIFDF